MWYAGASASWVCPFSLGDGSGGTEKYLKRTSSEAECSAYVKSARPTANGATWGTGNRKCYAEFGMTGKAFLRSFVLRL